MIRRNLGYKLVALAAAIGLWFYVTGEEIGTAGTSITVGLQLRNLPSTLRVVNAPQTVVITSEKAIIAPNQRSKVVAFVDLSRARGGDNSAVVQTHFPGDQPPSARVSPPSVVIRLAENSDIAQKDLLVSPKLTGKPASGYVLGEVTIDPPEVTVSGPSKALATLNLLRTRPVDISKLSGTITKEVGIDVPPGLTARSALKAKVTVQVAKP